MGRLSRNLKMMWAVIVAHLKSMTHFRSKLVIDISITLFRVLLLLLLYMNIYKLAPQANAILPYTSAMWSLGAYFIALAFNGRRIFRIVSELIYSGNIETYLVRPLHFLLFQTGKLLGESMIQAVITIVTVIIVLLVAVGQPLAGINIGFVLAACLLLTLGIAIDILISAFVGLLAIWLENATPVYWIVDKFVLILGGSYVPVAFFPSILKYISLYSPFGATRFASYAFYPDFSEKFLSYVGIQLFWLIVLLFSTSWLFKKGQYHLFVNGS